MTSQIELIMATRVTDIQPKGSKKIHFKDNLTPEDWGATVHATLETFPKAPVIVIETPDATIYMMVAKEKPE